MHNWLRVVFAVVIAVCNVEAEDIENGKPELLITEDRINQTLNEISSKLSDYDPYAMSKLQINLDHESGYVNFDVEDIRITGFSQFWATNLQVSDDERTVYFDIYFPQIHVIAPYYKIDALLVFIPFYGSGFLNLRGNGFSMGGSVVLTIEEDEVTGVEHLRLRFSLDESNLIITGLLYNEPMSQIVSISTTECFPEFVNSYGERLGKLAGIVIEAILNREIDQMHSQTSRLAKPGGTEHFSVGSANISITYAL